jgi:hypothetical protein
VKEDYYPKPATPLHPQRLFNSSMTPKATNTPSNTWHHLPPPLPILSRIAQQNKSQVIQPTEKPDASNINLY